MKAEGIAAQRRGSLARAGRTITSSRLATTLLTLGIPLLVSFGLWLIAYQRPFRMNLPIGGNVELRRREDDAPYLRGINGSEPYSSDNWRWWELLIGPDDLPYRWTSDDTRLHFPGLGGDSYLVELTVRSGHPDHSSAPSHWQIGANLNYAIDVPDGPPLRYSFLAKPDSSGDVDVILQTTPFAPQGDPRELGFVLHEVRLASLGDGPYAPAWPQLGWLALTCVLLYVTARVLAVHPIGAGALAGGAGLAAGLALFYTRTTLTSFTPILGGLALSCAASGTLAGIALRAWAPPRIARPAAHILALILLAFILRVGGMIHPHAMFSDAGFNASNLFRVTLGEIFLKAALPGEAGGGYAPYPPGLYLLLLPGQLFLADGFRPRVIFVQAGTALLDSLTLGVIWLLLTRAGFGTRAALFGAACYLLPGPLLEAFSVGEYANIGGQALALPLVALLGLGAFGDEGRAHADRRPTTDERAALAFRAWPLLLLLIGAMALGLLGHSGVTLSVGALIAIAWLMSLLARLRNRPWPIDLARLTIVAAAGLGLVLLIFYSAPVYMTIFSSRAGAGGTAGVEPLRLARETLLGLLGIIPPRNRALLLNPVLVPAYLGGLGLLWARRQSQLAADRLRALLGAWFLSILLTQGLLLVSDQGVRWAIFLYPALCLSAGVLLDTLWQKSSLGRIAASLVLAAILAQGALTWVIQLRDYYHT